MTIKEVEERTGLSRSSVRFYEKEKLVVPSRNESNGYRDYSENNIADIKKIAYLRTLGITIEDIRNIISEKAELHEVIRKQNVVLNNQIADLNKAKMLCERMLATENINYKELQVEQYVTGLQGYWHDNEPVFKLDSVSFLSIWGSFITWTALTLLCLMTAFLFFSKLPPKIPVQWHKGEASSLVDRKFIFAYPAACIVIRYLLRPCICAKLQMNHYYGELITEYLTNYMCFIVLSVELFSIIYGIVKNVVVVLFMDTVVLIGLLVTGLTKMNLKYKNVHN